jgi:hypothetical protein
MLRSKTGRFAASFAAGFLAVVVSSTAIFSASARMERPLGDGRCAPPRGSCVRFVTAGVVPAESEVESFNGDGFDVIFTLPSGREVFHPATGGGDVTAQDIGL